MRRCELQRGSDRRQASIPHKEGPWFTYYSISILFFQLTTIPGNGTM